VPIWTSAWTPGRQRGSGGVIRFYHKIAGVGLVFPRADRLIAVESAGRSGRAAAERSVGPAGRSRRTTPRSRRPPTWWRSGTMVELPLTGGRKRYPVTVTSFVSRSGLNEQTRVPFVSPELSWTGYSRNRRTLPGKRRAVRALRQLQPSACRSRRPPSIAHIHVSSLGLYASHLPTVLKDEAPRTPASPLFIGFYFQLVPAGPAILRLGAVNVARQVEVVVVLLVADFRDRHEP
jgi:hypothetical protein